jgi:hypothetical protein
LAVLEEGEIGEGVADVGEVVAEVLAEDGQFVVSREVGGSVGGENAGKEPKVGGDAVGYGGVGGGREVDRTACGLLLLKILQKLAVVWEMRYV